MSQSIDRKKAERIALEHCHTKNIEIYDKQPPGTWIYNAPKDPCWYAIVLEDFPIMLDSSRILCISRETGEILYDGSAGDEG